MRRTTSVSSALNDATTNTVNYTYTNDNLTQISVNSGEVVYDITYNQWDQPSEIRVGNGTTSRLLIKYFYDSNNNLMEITYGNQGWEHYSYDSLDRLTEKYYYDTNESVYYYYDPNGNLYKVYDEFSKHRGRFYVFGLKVSLVIIIREQNTQNRPLCSLI